MGDRENEIGKERGSFPDEKHGEEKLRKRSRKRCLVVKRRRRPASI